MVLSVNRGQTPPSILLLTALFLASCGEGNKEDVQESTYEATNMDVAPIDISSVGEELSEPMPIPAPSEPAHYYDARDGIFYSYYTAVSEDDRKAGRAAGGVITFAYMGMRGDKHVLAQVRANRSVIGESYCKDPCEVITSSDGRETAYTERSVIGAAFADAIRGHLEVAIYNRPEPQGSTDTLLADEKAASPEWSQEEALLISKWMAADQSCRFGTSTAKQEDGCANRDGIYSASLSQAGICTTRKTRFGTKFEMHRCDEDSVLN